MCPNDGSKDKGDDAPTGTGPKFLVGMDGRPVRYPMTDETFEEFRRRLLDAPGSEVVSVERFDENVVTVVTRGSGPASTSTVKLISEVAARFNVGKTIAIRPESA